MNAFWSCQGDCVRAGPAYAEAALRGQVSRVLETREASDEFVWMKSHSRRAASLRPDQRWPAQARGPHARLVCFRGYHASGQDDSLC